MQEMVKIGCKVFASDRTPEYVFNHLDKPISADEYNHLIKTDIARKLAHDIVIVLDNQEAIHSVYNHYTRSTEYTVELYIGTPLAYSKVIHDEANKLVASRSING